MENNVYYAYKLSIVITQISSLVCRCTIKDSSIIVSGFYVKGNLGRRAFVMSQSLLHKYDENLTLLYPSVKSLVQLITDVHSRWILMLTVSCLK